MIYPEYHKNKIMFLNAQKIVNDILDEHAIIFQKTQPKSTTAEYEREYDKKIKISSSGGSMVNQSEAYVIEMEQRQINERLNGAKDLMLNRLDMLRIKEDELLKSRNKFDLIYVARYIDHMKASQIAEKINYSESHVHRMLKKIAKNVRMIENDR